MVCGVSCSRSCLLMFSLSLHLEIGHASLYLRLETAHFSLLFHLEHVCFSSVAS